MREQSPDLRQLSGHPLVTCDSLQGLDFAHLVGEHQALCIVWGNHSKRLQEHGLRRPLQLRVPLTDMPPCNPELHAQEVTFLSPIGAAWTHYFPGDERITRVDLDTLKARPKLVSQAPERVFESGGSDFLIQLPPHPSYKSKPSFPPWE